VEIIRDPDQAFGRAGAPPLLSCLWRAGITLSLGLDEDDDLHVPIGQRLKAADLNGARIHVRRQPQSLRFGPPIERAPPSQHPPANIIMREPNRDVKDEPSRASSIHRPGAGDAGGGLDAGADGEPVNALEDGVVNGPHLLVAQIGAHGVHPQDET